MGSLKVVLVGFVFFIFLFVCVFFIFCLSSLFILFPMLPGFFLDCPYLIAPSVFLYLKSICVAFHYQNEDTIIKTKSLYINVFSPWYLWN